jgi:putative adhesin
MKAAALLSLALLLTSSSAHAAKRKTYPMNVPATGVRSITFKVQEGDFVVRGDANIKEVQMDVSIDRMFIFKLGEKDILKRLITVSGEGTDHLTIVTDIPRSIANWGRAEYPIDFEVVIPAGAQLEIEDTSGKMEVAGVRGDVVVRDGSGTFWARDLGGALDLVKESGDIRIERIAGATSIQSHSGQMTLRDLRALEIKESDGNIDASQLTSARIQNKGGNVKVTSVAGDLRVDDDSGEIVIADVKGTLEIRDTSGQIRTQNTGAITIRDTSGDVTVRNAPELRVLEKESGAVKISQVSGRVEAPPGIEVKRQ